MKEVMIAGVTSGVGKTTVTLGLLQALVNRKLMVQPFKVGPDYIDTGYHSYLCQKDSINIDAFLVPDPHVLRALYTRALQGADIAVVEGVMGLYDGLGTDKRYCSSAGAALALGLPVILVIDGQATSTSAAAIVKGFMDLDPEVNIQGVIVNRAASPGHYELIKTAIERYCSLAVLGYLPKDSHFSLPSRQLGLVPGQELPQALDRIAEIAEVMAQTVDLDQVLEIAECGDSPFDPSSLKDYERPVAEPLTVAYAYDSAFSFYYKDNLRLLEDKGVELLPFSPLSDSQLSDADAYYFGGGFPELFARELSANRTFMASVRAAHEAGIPIYGECGGLMYLAESIQLAEACYPMVGILAGHSYMLDRLRRFGYCQMTPLKDCLLGQAGDPVRGHEFHYSEFETPLKPVAHFTKERDGQVVKEWQHGYQVQASFASYLYTHFYQSPDFLDGWLDNIIHYKHQRRNNG